MSIDKKAFGISDSLVSAVNEALKGGQHKIDVAEPKGKITGADFKKLRGEGAKPDFLDLDKDGNKKEPMKTAVKQAKEDVQIDELSTDTYHSAAHKAAKRAMGDAQGRSGPIFKKYAGMANKFRDKGVSQEKKEKAMKEEVEILENSQEIAKKYKDYVTGGGSTQTASRYKSHVNMLSKKTGQHPDAINKEVRKHVKAMKEETVSEVSDAAKKVLGAVAKKHGGKVPFTSTTYKDGKKVVTRGHNDEKGNRVVTSTANEETDPGFVTEVQRRADMKVVKVRMPDGGVTYKKVRPHTDVQHEANDAVSNQIAAKKDQFKKQLQQKIAAKQMNVMQSKANKRLANIHASNDKCSCQEGKGKSMTCEMHGDKSKDIKSGKDQIIVNPPMKEAAELPKKVITKGHEIAKSLIKHKSKVDNPYAVGMAAAKKSAKIKAYRADRDKNKED